VIRPVWTTLAAFALLVPVGERLEAQPVRTAADGFAAAWRDVDLEALRIRFHDSSRLSLNGVAHTGLRPEHVVSTLKGFLRAHLPALPTVVRAEPMESQEGYGFAELAWETADVESGTPARYTLLVTFTRIDAALLVSDLRILP